MEPNDVELEALVQTATEAEDLVRDRESEEDAHNAWADADDVAEDLSDAGSGDADVAVSAGGSGRPWWDDED